MGEKESKLEEELQKIFDEWGKHINPSLLEELVKFIQLRESKRSGWVKASDRLPANRDLKFIKIEGTFAIGYYQKHSDMWVNESGDFFPSDQIEYLDESPSSVPEPDAEKDQAMSKEKIAELIQSVMDSADWKDDNRENLIFSKNEVIQIVGSLVAQKDQRIAELEKENDYLKGLVDVNMMEATGKIQQLEAQLKEQEGFTQDWREATAEANRRTWKVEAQLQASKVDAEKLWEQCTNRMDYTAKIHAARYKKDFIKAIQSLHQNK